MKLTPLDIKKQEFTRSFRGFDAEEVHAFLQMLSNQWEELLDESRRRDQKIRDLQSKLEHYERVEEALQEALQTARESAKKSLENAEEKARLIIEAARAGAEDVKREAEQEHHQMKRDTAKLNSRRTEIVTRLRAFLMSEMELLARFEGDDPVGFIKLLPAEEHRARRLASELSREEKEEKDAFPGEEERVEPGARADEPERRNRIEFASTHPEEPVYEEDEDDFEDEEDLPELTVRHHSASGEEPETSWEDREEDVDEGESDEEIARGPGWTSRTVISRSADHYPHQSRRDLPDDEADDAESRASSEEIEKIRRILSDLD